MYTAIHASCSSRSRTVQGESTNSRPRRRVSHDISYEKCVCKCPGMCSYEIIGLKVPWNEQLRKRGGGGWLHAGFRLSTIETSRRFGVGKTCPPPKAFCRLRRGYWLGMVAETSFERTLSTFLESTAVTT